MKVCPSHRGAARPTCGSPATPGWLSAASSCAILSSGWRGPSWRCGRSTRSATATDARAVRRSRVIARSTSTRSAVGARLPRGGRDARTRRTCTSGPRRTRTRRRRRSTPRCSLGSGGARRPATPRTSGDARSDHPVPPGELDAARPPRPRTLREPAACGDAPFELRARRSPATPTCQPALAHSRGDPRPGRRRRARAGRARARRRPDRARANLRAVLRAGPHDLLAGPPPPPREAISRLGSETRKRKVGITC